MINTLYLPHPPVTIGLYALPLFIPPPSQVPYYTYYTRLQVRASIASNSSIRQLKLFLLSVLLHLLLGTYFMACSGSNCTLSSLLS
jgi:hypothetical protein